MKRTPGIVLGLAGLTLAVVGCQAPKIDLDQMLQPPPRPEALNHLDMFVGQWAGTGAMKMSGVDETVEMTGNSNIRWVADKWVLLEEFEGSMKGHAMKGVGMWTWDPAAKKYRMHWVDSYGANATAEATYDEATRTFSMKGKMRDPDGHTTVSEGTARFVDDNTMEWKDTGWDSWRLSKIYEMTGTSKRK